MSAGKGIAVGLASLGVCGLGTYAMYISGGETGIGWSVLALFIIWVNV